MNSIVHSSTSKNPSTANNQGTSRSQDTSLGSASFSSNARNNYLLNENAKNSIQNTFSANNIDYRKETTISVTNKNETPGFIEVNNEEINKFLNQTNQRTRITTPIEEDPRVVLLKNAYKEFEQRQKYNEDLKMQPLTIQSTAMDARNRLMKLSILNVKRYL